MLNLTEKDVTRILATNFSFFVNSMHIAHRMVEIKRAKIHYECIVQSRAAIVLLLDFPRIESSYFAIENMSHFYHKSTTLMTRITANQQTGMKASTTFNYLEPVRVRNCKTVSSKTIVSKVLSH